MVDTRWSSKSGLMRQILQLLSVLPEAAAEDADTPARRQAAVETAVGFHFHSFGSLVSSLKPLWKPDLHRWSDSFKPSTCFFSGYFSRERFYPVCEI